MYGTACAKVTGTRTQCGSGVKGSEDVAKGPEYDSRLPKVFAGLRRSSKVSEGLRTYSHVSEGCRRRSYVFVGRRTYSDSDRVVSRVSPYITPPLRRSVPMRRARVARAWLAAQSEPHPSEVHGTDAFRCVGISPIVLRDQVRGV